MAKKFLMTAEEVMDELGVSRAFAYKLMQKMNKELAEKGFTVINGKVSRKYFKNCSMAYPMLNCLCETT